MLESYEKAVQKVYESLDSCIIIGLTGRTGSGCTTTAKILETKNFKELPLKTPKKSEFCDIEERKTAVVYNFLQNNWTPFISIEVSSVILSYVFEKGFEKFVDFIKKLVKPNESKNFSINGYEDLMKKQMDYHIYLKIRWKSMRKLMKIIAKNILITLLKQLKNVKKNL